MSTTNNHTINPLGKDADALVRALDALSLKNKKLVKATVHDAPADPEIKISSWKMDEFKYSVHPSPFPTLARGLFTRKIGDTEHAVPLDGPSADSSDGTKRHVIVARGYDKFFNIGEVPWNSWPSIEKYTKGPYHLTLKSNGCIIFIAALSPTKLVVTSKHSLGRTLGDGSKSHAMMGEQWLHKHLNAVGKTPEDLASRLWRENLTAVAELCDDSFEEHVLAYPPELSGLHLHGLNKNTAAFSTYSPSEVDAFAQEFGCFKTAHINFDTASDVHAFTDNLAETGSWNGEAVEGFVVRCKIADRSTNAGAEDLTPLPTPSDKKGKHGDSWKNSAIIMHPPYPSGSDYFFKVKFDEPYLMYRAWREITKSILSAKAKGLPISIPKSRLARVENKLYREWVEHEIDAHPGDFVEYLKGKGIIEARERFLRWFNTKEGQKRFMALGDAVVDTAKDVRSDQPKAEQTGKLVIVPIAVPGCGKTSVAIALTHLFPSFGHTQSDDVKAKKTAPTFQKNIADLLKNHDVVVADRNNHLVQHRQGIRAAADAATPQSASSPASPVRLVALNWSLDDLPLSTIHRICSSRVVARGGNHQSLRPSPKVSHEDVIWQFISSAEALGEDEVDKVVEMNVAAENLETAVSAAVEGLIPVLSEWVKPPLGEQSWRRPTPDQIRDACNAAIEYKVTVKKQDGSQGTKKSSAIRYFAFLPEVDIVQLVEDLLFGSAVATKTTTNADSSNANLNTHSNSNSTAVDIQSFWTLLKSSNRIVRRPHITITHQQNLPEQQVLWDSCMATVDAIIKDSSSSPALFEFQLGTLLCDDKVMSIVVDDIRLVPTPPPPSTLLEKSQAATATTITPTAATTTTTTTATTATTVSAAEKLLQDIPEASKARFHITVGTRNEDTKPFQGGKLVERWKATVGAGAGAGAKGDYIMSVPIVGKRIVGRVRGLLG